MFPNSSFFCVIITKWEPNEFIFPSSINVPNPPPPDSSIPYKHYHFIRPLAASVWAAISKYRELGGLSNKRSFVTVLEPEVQDQGTGGIGIW